PVMRPLSARLAQSGSPDVITAGRYLDQIAAALEFAYQQATLHRNLSPDCVFLQLDGHVLVGDFGVRRLVELLGPSSQRHPFYGSVEACAPEQIRGERVDAYTDVYALGAVAYRLLTGQPVFRGDTLDEILERHLYEQPSPLAGWRDDLPPGLEGILAGALAKDPAHRFPSAGAFANAYHEVVTPNNKTRVPFAVGAPAFGASASPPARGIGAASYPAPDRSQPPTAASTDAWSHSGASSDPFLATSGVLTANGSARLRSRSRAPSVWRGGREERRGRIAVIAAMLLVLLGSGLFVVYGGSLIRGGAVAAAAGVVTFVDRPNSPPGHTDALQITLHNLPAPSAGAHYDAWLVDQQSEHIIPLGAVTATNSASQTYTLSFPQGAGTGTPGANLLGLGGKIEVTLEQGTVTAPVGHVVLTGIFPPQAFVHIQHLLVSFPTTPGKIGLLVGVLNQAQELDAQASALQNAATAGKPATMQCIAQSMLDIIEGAQGVHYRPLSPSCAALNVTLTGDGFGLLGTTSSTSISGYLDDTSDHASLAATQPDATDGIRLHASHVEIAMTNIKGWVTQADQDALQILVSPTDAAALSGLVLACDDAYHGRSTNPDQTVNPVPGEAGAQTAYEHGQFMATLTLVASN
ncbi:MAG: serine/threonine protein kinase, partial [Ktedonobacterales bacterium]